MAVLVESRDSFELLRVPFISNFMPEDKYWVIDHLQAMADKLKKENVDVFSIGLSTNLQYRVPELEILVYRQK